MNFNRWLEFKLNKEFEEKEKKDYDKSKGFLGRNYHDRLIQLYLAYENYRLVEKTKWLVWATWALAIVTIILALIR
jgi:hypothetical protein